VSHFRYAGENVLVTGGAGAIGGHLVRRLEEVSAKVIVLDDLSSGEKDNLCGTSATFVRGSVTDSRALDEVFADEIHAVYHLAALFANQNSVEHPALDLSVNGEGTLRVLERARIKGVDRFVFVSSSCIYGNADGVLTEDLPPGRLDTPYAATKLLGEHYTQFFHDFYGLPTVIVRLFNTYGPGERPGPYRNVIPNFIYRALRGKPLPITGNGEETRDFNYVGDTVQGLLLAGGHPAAVGRIYNIATGREVRILDLANLINQLTGNQAGIDCCARRRWDHVSRRVGSIARIAQELGYRSTVSLEEGLRHTYEWIKTRALA